MKKKNLILIGVILATIILAILSVVTALKIKQLGTQPVAPSAPKSKPKAEEEIPDIPPSTASCRQTFTVALGPSLTPTPTNTPGPSPTPTNTPPPGSTPTPTNTPPPESTPTPTSTPGPNPTPTGTPGPTSTPTPTGTLTPTPTGTLTPSPKPTATTVVQATPTEAQLPQAGLKIPTLGGMIAGFLLIALGVALIF